MGQLTLQLAKASGCMVIGVDFRADRLDRARRLGADYVYHASEHDLQKEIALVTQQMKFVINKFPGGVITMLYIARKKKSAVRPIRLYLADQ